MKKLELKQNAFAIASSTIGQNLSFLDAAVAVKASELKLSDADYTQFRQDAIQYRGGLLPAYQADQKASAPKPAPAVAGAVAPKA